MHKLTRNQLMQFIDKYGQSICQDSSKCESLLKENYLQYPSETLLLTNSSFLLINSFRQGIPKKLLNSQNSQMPKEVTLGTLTTQLQDKLYITETAANWTVETWGIALKIIQPQEWNPPSGHSPPKLNNEPQKHLKTILKNHSPFRCKCDPRYPGCAEACCPKKIKSYLQDYCPQYPAETLLLVNSLEQGIVTKLIANETQDISTELFTELTQHLENQIYLIPTAAKWALESWLKALAVQENKAVNSSFYSVHNSQPTDLDLQETIYLTSHQMQYGVMHRIVINQEAINVQVPPGTKNNTRLRLKGKGKFDPNTQQRGNLYLRIEELEIEPQEESIDNSNFDTKLINLDIEETIFLTEEQMLNGVRKRLVTDNKDYDIKIPAGTKVGSRIRLQGQGLVDPNSQQQGDLYLLVEEKSNSYSVESKELIYEGINYTKLKNLLDSHSWKESNEETDRLMLEIANCQDINCLTIKAIKKFPCIHLKMIDYLWKTASNNLFGLSVQQELWNNLGKNWKSYCQAVKWKEKKVYKLFPQWNKEEELYFSLDKDTVQGHLPAWYLWTDEEGQTFMKKLNKCFQQDKL
ncbi:MAG: hypothetical protein Tsb0014_04920 [Pleurocapsa sp.]